MQYLELNISAQEHLFVKIEKFALKMIRRNERYPAWIPLEIDLRWENLSIMNYLPFPFVCISIKAKRNGKTGIDLISIFPISISNENQC